MLENLLPLLRLLSDGEFHSGDSLGAALGVSRTAIWKSIKKISALGLEVHSVKGKGYRLQQGLELLDRSLLCNALKTDQINNIAEFVIFNSVDSTNSYVLQKMQQGGLNLTNGKVVVCLAEQQTQGKGRRGREWVSPFGRNMYLSLGREFELGVQGLEGLSLVVGLALIRALEYCGVSDLGIKWPNDVLWQNKKLAGILLEMTGDLTDVCQVVIGVGLNIQMEAEKMQQVDQPWADLGGILPDLPSRNWLIGSVISQLMLILEEFENKGFVGFMEEWLKFDLLLEQEIVIHKTMRANSSGNVSGVACGVDSSGSLLLRTSTGLHPYKGGEVSLKAN